MMPWIKIEKGTPEKPAIRHVARTCGCSMDSAFAAFFRLWCWFDDTTADGDLPLVTREDCDAQAGLPGIAQALVEAKWLEFHAEGCTVLGWEQHNGASAKKRAQTAKRVARHREKTGDESGYRPWRARRM